MDIYIGIINNRSSFYGKVNEPSQVAYDPTS